MPSTTPDVMISAQAIHKAFGANQVHLCATGPNAGKRHRSLPWFDSLDAGQVIAAVDPLLP